MKEYLLKNRWGIITISILYVLLAAWGQYTGDWGIIGLTRLFVFYFVIPTGYIIFEQVVLRKHPEWVKRYKIAFSALCLLAAFIVVFIYWNEPNAWIIWVIVVPICLGAAYFTWKRKIPAEYDPDPQQDKNGSVGLIIMVVLAAAMYLLAKYTNIN